MNKEPVNSKIFNKLNECLANCKYLAIDNTQELDSIDEFIAKIVAAFCLEHNIKADKFNSLFRYQLVNILKTNEPEIAGVQIAARTGINRRYIKQISKATKQSKDMLIMSYLVSYCLSNKTTHIKKTGLFSFDYYCKKGASGSLTTKAIADELLRQGYIEEKGSRYKINFAGFPPARE